MIIKFSHLYSKMPRDYQHSKLMQVFPIDRADLGLDFLLYDTSYNEGGEEKQYPLPEKGAYLVLLLRAGSGHGALWTTIRSRWGGGRDKLAYYRGKMGEVAECRISE
jgi:hypothetical protein